MVVLRVLEDSASSCTGIQTPGPRQTWAVVYGEGTGWSDIWDGESAGLCG